MARRAVALKKVETTREELEMMRRRVSERAYAISRTHPDAVGRALNDWLAAEQQLVWKPAIEVCQCDNQFVVQAALAGVEPDDLTVEITPSALLIRAPTSHGHPPEKGIVHVCEFTPGVLFRSIRFPVRVDSDRAKAEYRNGLLRVAVPIASDARTGQDEDEIC